MKSNVSPVVHYYQRTKAVIKTPEVSVGLVKVDRINKFSRPKKKINNFILFSNKIVSFRKSELKDKSYQLNLLTSNRTRTL